MLCGRNVLVLRRSTLKYLGMKCHICNLFSTAPARKKRKKERKEGKEGGREKRKEGKKEEGERESHKANVTKY